MLLKLKRFFLQELFKETWSEALKCNDDYKVNCKVLDLLAGSHSTQVSPTVNIHPLFELLLFTDLIKEVDDLSIFFFLLQLHLFYQEVMITCCVMIIVYIDVWVGHPVLALLDILF